MRLSVITFTSTFTLALSGALTAGSARIAEAQSPARWQLSPAPTLSIGAEEASPEALLQVIVFATRLPSGAIMVGDRGEHALKLFDAQGRFQRAFARQGGGPGEVRYLGKMFRCGDSLYTYDIEEGHRMSVFTLDGRYQRTFHWKTPPGQQVPYATACNADGAFVHHGWDAPGRITPGIHRANVALWMGRADSSAARIVDSIPGSERWGQTHEGRIIGSRPLPLGKEPVVGIGRTRAYAGSANDFVLNVYDLEGRRIGELRRGTGAAHETSAADIRAEIERAVLENGESKRRGVERSYEGITFPKTLPAYTALVVDAEDHAWVRAFPRATDAAATWSVFSPSGALVAEVSVPKDLEVFEIGRDYVLGRMIDPEELVPQVRTYRLERR